MMRWTLCCAVVSLLVLGSPPASAEPPIDPEVVSREIAGSVMSPFCPGRLLNDCPSTAAQQLKTKIREDVAGGKSADTVMEELVAQYGPSIRAEPSTSGFGLLAWLTPILFLLIGGYVWASIAGRRRRPSTEPTDVTPEMLSRIEDELQRER